MLLRASYSKTVSSNSNLCALASLSGQKDEMRFCRAAAKQRLRAQLQRYTEAGLP
jgi:hypothetical protein